MSTLVERVVMLAQARAAYEEAYQQRDLDPNPYTELVLRVARQRLSVVLAVKEDRG